MSSITNKTSQIEMKVVSTVDSESGKILDKPCFPFRYCIAIICSFTTAIMFAVRTCLTVAIVSMTYDDDTINANKTTLNYENSSVTIELLIPEKFHWTASQEGVVLGAYFYGYSAFQIITGVIADKFNVVRLNIVCGLISSALTAFIPMAARAGVLYISIVRIIIGISHAPIIALILVLASKWFPPDEVVIPIGLLNFGCNIGTAAVMPFTAWLCTKIEYGGWSTVFYAMALINLIIPIGWFLLITPTPDTHRFVSKYEVDYINKANSNIGLIKMKVPWLSIFSSVKIWTIIIAKGCLALGYMVVNTKIPAYLESELGMDLSSNGSFNSLLYIAIAISNVSSGPLFKYFINKGILSRTTARKVAESITIFLPAMALLSIPFIGQNTMVIMVLLVVACFCMGFQSAGDWPIVSEVAPDLAGSVFGICNTIGSAAGFISPLIIGALLDSGLPHSQAWRDIFYMGSGVMILGGLVFTIFAKTDPEPWGVAPARSTDSLATVIDTQRRPRPKMRIHPVFSRQASVA